MYNGRYHEFSFWSPILGCQASRISMTDDYGAEHFMIIRTDEPGKKLREARAEALSKIATHITAGRPAGEVETAAAV